MDKSINILDQDYSLWIQDLSKRYRRSQIKASIKVNGEMLKFYWSLGRDIVAMKAESRWGSKFFKNLSKDLKEANQKATCFSEGNLKYMKNFYCMYQPYFEIGQQLADQFQLILLHRDRSQDWHIHLCRCRSVRWLCCSLQSHSSQGERPHSGTICS